MSDTEDGSSMTKRVLLKVGKLKIKKQLSGPVLAQRQAAKVRMLNVTEYVEVYAYTTLLVIFAYIIAMAVIGMAYGKESKKRPRNDDYDIGQDMFYLAYMTSIMVVPVATTILQL